LLIQQQKKTQRTLDPDISFALSFKRKYGHVTQRKKQIVLHTGTFA